MRVLVIGGGGREHALVWKLGQSGMVSKVWCAPGNGGISRQAECVPVNLGEISAVADLAEKLQIDLTIVGPEQPLVDGIADEFEGRKLRIIGPSSKCARLEGSKVFAKEFLTRHNIPTAGSYGVFDSVRDATKQMANLAYPLVLKADGLCAGKGVLVAKSQAEAIDFVDRVLGKAEFGKGGARILVEEALAGKELSFIVLSDGRDFAPLVATRDHKRAFDGDAGPNTGGMGAYSCDGIISVSMEADIRERIVEPTLTALRQEGCEYRGFLYFGLMLTSEGPKVLEFNCRLGDPETQAIVPRMDFDFGAVLSAVADRKLSGARLNWLPGASVCVVMASGGYPGNYGVGKEIQGLAKAEGIPGVNVFHAGTKSEGGLYYTSSGRVLGVTATGGSLDAARATAYDAVGCVHFEGAQYRSDIALGERLSATVAED